MSRSVCRFPNRFLLLTRAVLLCITVILLLYVSASAASGAREGLALCGELLIPSLFPMMVLSSLLQHSGTADVLGRLLAPFVKGLFRLPPCAGTAFLTAMLGGYPAGARSIRTLLEQHRITAAQAARMLLFCVGAGPGFVISAVGCGLFGSRLLGIVLYTAQVLSAVLLGICSRFGTKVSSENTVTPVFAKSLSFAEALTTSVHEAASAMLTLCATVIVFSSLQAVVFSLLPTQAPFVRLLFSVLLEVTEGVRTARSAASPVLTAFALGWGGFCTHAQVFAVSGMRCRYFFVFRFLHGLLTALFTAGMWQVLAPHNPVFLPAGTVPHVAASAVHGGVSAALMCLTAVFTLSITADSADKVHRT